MTTDSDSKMWNEIDATMNECLNWTPKIRWHFILDSRPSWLRRLLGIFIKPPRRVRAYPICPWREGDVVTLSYNGTCHLAKIKKIDIVNPAYGEAILDFTLL